MHSVLDSTADVLSCSVTRTGGVLSSSVGVKGDRKALMYVSSANVSLSLPLAPSRSLLWLLLLMVVVVVDDADGDDAE